MTLLVRLLALVGFPSWVAPVLMVGLVLSGLGAAYVKGRMDASSSCKEEALKAEIAAMQRDLDISKKAEEHSKRVMAKLSEEINKREKELVSYEEELRNRSDKCYLTPDDISRMRFGTQKGPNR